jgi:hypothetical protein
LWPLKAAVTVSARRRPVAGSPAYDGRKVAASNKYTIVLQRAPGHKLGYYIYTAYPEP